MPRANRHFQSGHIWHITHRCHKQEFLLKFSRDRARWLHWLFEAKKRFGLHVLNYVVTSNHIHLLVQDTGEQIIPKSMQLIAGRTAQEYNQRKKRRGAYWEDRYHATAIDTETHLSRCLTYIDLNMVRTGVVDHPNQWVQGGYHELQNPPKRYAIINHQTSLELSHFIHLKEYQNARLQWIDDAIQNNHSLNRQENFTEALAVGSEEFVTKFKSTLAIKQRNKKIIKDNDEYSIREPKPPYNCNFDSKMEPLSTENTFYWDV